MKIGNHLNVEFHRTVRVADNRAPVNLPPSLGRAVVTPVSKYREQCPDTWEDTGVFIPLHDTEALWIQLSSPSRPIAVLLGAGGINALTGEKLTTTLSIGNYMTVPPQPWIDGWKGEDGSVYQFVATPYQDGDGLSVGEQILGKESVSGGIGIAVFDSKEPLQPSSGYHTGVGYDPWGETPLLSLDVATGYSKGMTLSTASAAPVMRGGGPRFNEMGVGKGGKITQKIYSDPYGIEVWNATPSATMAVYLVDAKTYEQITGIAIPVPKGQESYQGPWFGQHDQEAQDLPGTGTFTGLKSVFAAGSEKEVQAEEQEG